MLSTTEEETQCSVLIGSAMCRTHCHIVLEVFLAANKVRDI